MIKFEVTFCLNLIISTFTEIFLGSKTSIRSRQKIAHLTLVSV